MKQKSKMTIPCLFDSDLVADLCEESRIQKKKVEEIIEQAVIEFILTQKSLRKDLKRMKGGIIS